MGSHVAVKREMVDGGEEGGGLVDGGARATAERHAGKTTVVRETKGDACVLSGYHVEEST